MVISIIAVEDINLAWPNTSESVSSRPIVGRRPTRLKNHRRVITKKPSAVSSMQCNVIATDKNSSLDPPLGDSRTKNNRRASKAQPCMAKK
jgi:hypothetical protein